MFSCSTTAITNTLQSVFASGSSRATAAEQDCRTTLKKIESTVEAMRAEQSAFQKKLFHWLSVAMPGIQARKSPLVLQFAI